MSQGYQDADNLKSIANSEANVIKPIPVEFQRRSGVLCLYGVWCVAEAADGKKAEGGEGKRREEPEEVPPLTNWKLAYGVVTRDKVVVDRYVVWATQVRYYCLLYIKRKSCSLSLR